MINLGLTFDYELFGDGGGDVFTHIIYPTERILNTLNLHNIKATIFFEVIEYWKLKEEYNRGNTMGYKANPIEAMESQLKEACRNGHDIQLHIHPQWLNAFYSNDMWHVDSKLWRTSEIVNSPTSKYFSFENILLKGKETLEELFLPINPNYKCNIFRAGGYNIFPSEKVVKALLKVGFIADSSVYAGGYVDSDLSKYDYRTISNQKPYWFSRGDLIQDFNAGLDEGDGIIELPIYAENRVKFMKYDLTRVITQLKNKKESIKRLTSSSNKTTMFEHLNNLLNPDALTWDFCLFNKRKTAQYLEKSRAISKVSCFTFHPFILIGHPKDFIFSGTLHFLLRKTKHDNYLTLTEIIGYIKSSHSSTKITNRTS